ncbi:MAG: hypothetical protein IT184_02770 [Acidobacteria bacterium]|nr:hypothetical protein [Acidobacteriota bacterium]
MRPESNILVALLLGILAFASPARAQQPAPRPTPNLAQWRAYHERLVDVASQLAPQSSLVDLLQPMLALAETRGRTGDAAEESRSVLLAVAFYVNGWPISAVVPEARAWPSPARRTIVLRGRGDLAQHFTVSALIAAMAGEPLAAMIGLYKELRDARGGSGFSFSDLAADRAGTIFGQVAGTSDESAHQLHRKVAAGLTEDAMMPAIAGLPDNLSEAELTRRFGGVGGAAYNTLVAEIDARVGRLPLFR